MSAILEPIARTADAAGSGCTGGSINRSCPDYGETPSKPQLECIKLPYLFAGLAVLKTCLQELKGSGLQIIACSEKAGKFMYEVDLTGPIALVMGSEENGISEDLLKDCDAHVKIPMKGNISSLNVSVATGLILYECVRQRSDYK